MTSKILSVQDYRAAVQARRDKNLYSRSQIITYEYWAQVDRVVDGDTVDFRISLGFDAYIDKRCRLFGINSPELYSSSSGSPERIAGQAAKDWLTERLPTSHWCELRIFSDSPHDKYGRWLVEIFDDGANLNESLVGHGHAEFYL